MADEDLRELERTWLATGALDDGVAWHRARLRGGVVDRDGLRREAALGDRAAWAAADDVPSVLRRLDTWLRANAPDSLAGFNPPATEAEIAATEGAIGQPLPPLLRAIYLWRNGQLRPRSPDEENGPLDPDDPYDPRNAHLLVGFTLDAVGPVAAEYVGAFPESWRLLSLAEVRSAWAQRILKGVEPAPPPRDVVQAWPKACIPFMHRAAFLRCVDPSGWGTGATQQVVEGADVDIDLIVAPSLEHWFEVQVAALEQQVRTVGLKERSVEDRERTRLDYFSRAVTPGYPRKPQGGGLAVTPAPIQPGAREVADGTIQWATILFFFGYFVAAPGLMVVVVVLVAMPSSSLETWAWIKAATPWAVLLIGALAAAAAARPYLRRRRLHRQLLEEFSNASLDPPEEV